MISFFLTGRTHIVNGYQQDSPIQSHRKNLLPSNKNPLLAVEYCTSEAAYTFNTYTLPSGALLSDSIVSDPSTFY